MHPVMEARKGAGRPKGSHSKLTVAVKDAINYAAMKLGGGERLYAWTQEAPENERAFWVVIYPKLLPLTVSADIKAAITINWPLNKPAIEP